MKKLLLFISAFAVVCMLNAQQVQYKLKYLKGYGPDSISANGLGTCNWDLIPEWTSVSNPSLKLDGSLVAPTGDDFKVKFKMAYNEYALFGIFDVVDDVIVPLGEGENGGLGEVDFITIQMGADERYWPANTYVGYDIDPAKLHDLDPSFWWSGTDQESVTHKISATHYQVEFSFRWKIEWTKAPDKPITFPGDTMNFEVVASDCDESLAGAQSQLEWGNATGVAQGAWHEGNYMAENWGVFILPEVGIATSADTIAYNACGVGVEKNRKNDLKIYPNPTSDKLVFSSIVNADLYTLQGSIVRQIKQQQEMNVSDLPAGLYVIRVAGQTNLKVIIQ